MSKSERLFRVVQITAVPPATACDGSGNTLLKLEEVSRPGELHIFLTVQWPAYEVFLGMLVSIETRLPTKVA